MSIQAFWDDPNQRIIRFLYRRSNWEWHDFYAALEQACTLVESANRQVGFIIDVTNANLTPGIFMSQSKVLYEFNRHPAVSLVIVVGADRFIEALYRVSTVNVPAKEQYYFVKTVDDAHTILGELHKLRLQKAQESIPLTA